MLGSLQLFFLQFSADVLQRGEYIVFVLQGESGGIHGELEPFSVGIDFDEFMAAGFNLQQRRYEHIAQRREVL